MVVVVVVVSWGGVRQVVASVSVRHLHRHIIFLFKSRPVSYFSQLCIVWWPRPFSPQPVSSSLHLAPLTLHLSLPCLPSHVSATLRHASYITATDPALPHYRCPLPPFLRPFSYRHHVSFILHCLEPPSAPSLPCPTIAVSHPPFLRPFIATLPTIVAPCLSHSYICTGVDSLPTCLPNTLVTLTPDSPPTASLILTKLSPDCPLVRPWPVLYLISRPCLHASPSPLSPLLTYTSAQQDSQHLPEEHVWVSGVGRADRLYTRWGCGESG
ncbi:hypothetical protein E2C01_047810 [Portunus trituberculatus]|uniref:Uncharacterized protein n=1 Tax=Portunus trituberculatus TaxID=210409 RepID=A0A5B7G8R2_PORTR|nr:hypothetical protein [Portunus trituberculatus]